MRSIGRKKRTKVEKPPQEYQYLRAGKGKNGKSLQMRPNI